MIEIRRIRRNEGESVASLWDQMCREDPDGGPLTEQGRRNIAFTLEAAAWHRDAFCLVAVDEDRIVGFVNGRIDIGDGLLPGLAGEIETVWMIPAERGTGAGRRLAAAAIGWLRERGAGPIRSLVCAGDPQLQRFWAELGFEADMVCLSLYPEE